MEAPRSGWRRAPVPRPVDPTQKGTALCSPRMYRLSKRPEWPQQKVFCVGMHKSGTTSFHQLMSDLGARSLHSTRRSMAALGLGANNSAEEGDGTRSDLTARIDAPMLQKLVDQYDCFSDNPWPLLYRRLDVAFPGSRFVLTVRDTENWLRSQIEHFGEKNTQMRQWIYGFGIHYAMPNATAKYTSSTRATCGNISRAARTSWSSVSKTTIGRLARSCGRFSVSLGSRAPFRMPTCDAEVVSENGRRALTRRSSGSRHSSRRRIARSRARAGRQRGQLAVEALRLF